VIRSLSLSILAVRSLRNLQSVDIEPGPRFNVIAGENGQGKTNLLEAIYIVATSRSFRVSRPGDVIRTGDRTSSVRAEVLDGDTRRVQSVGLEVGRRHVRVDGKRPESLIAYAVQTPAVVFHPGEMVLSMGGGAERRRLLDRVALYLGGGGPEDLQAYTRALRERQRALETRGTAATDLEDWEAILVRHGVAVMLRRKAAAGRVAEAARSAFEQIGALGAELGVAYEPGAPEDERSYLERLRSSRAADARRGNATVGPHRDDVRLSLDGRPVRGVASQGEHRAIVLALKSAEVDVVASATGVRPLLLLDEVSSELDRARTASLFAFLQRHQGQVFLSTTRPELIDTGGLSGDAVRVDFRVSRGTVARV
jgi:DNA replication and repair protein RecF